MRVLLDPEKDAARPLDLLGNTAHPAAARRACNAVRTARNEAAHASDRTAAAQAAILFNEAVEALEEGYAGAPLRTSELGQYYRLAEDYLSRCGAKKPIASAALKRKPSRGKVRPEHCGQEKEGTSGSASRRSSTKQNTSGRSSGGRPQSRKQGSSRNSRARARQKQKQANRTVLLVLLAILAVGLLIRGFTMNWQ